MRTLITPDHAREILSNNTFNRPMSKSAIDVITDQIIKGQWKYNGQSIVISDGGELLDGQHRLSACVKSGISIECEIVKGVSKGSFDTMDSGRLRGGGDCLAIKGVSNSIFVASSLRGVVHFSSDKGLVFPFGSAGSKKVLNISLSNTYEWIDNEFFSHNKDFNSCSDFFGFIKSRMQGTNGFKLGCYGFAVLMTYMIDKEESIKFLDRVADGLFSSPTDPAKKIRDYITSGSMLPRKKKYGGGGSSAYRASMYFKAWNYFCDNKELNSLRLGDLTVSPLANTKGRQLNKNFKLLP